MPKPHDRPMISWRRSLERAKFAHAMVGFSERIKKRKRVWWGGIAEERLRSSFLDRLHRAVETHRLRTRHDPERRWKCCELWQRSLNNKWNSREFALRYGCRVPELYWCGRQISKLPIRYMPEHVVLRPSWSASGVGTRVLAGDYDVLHRRTCPRDSLIDQVRRERGRFSDQPILAEEFVRSEDGEYRLPTEYKCFTFGDTIAAVQVVHRQPGGARHRFYKPNWEPFDDAFNTYNGFDEVSVPPRCIGEILEAAKRLGAAYGTFVRADFYASDRGCIFGEFASVPLEGRGFTPFGDRYLGEAWEDLLPADAT